MDLADGKGLLQRLSSPLRIRYEVEVEVPKSKRPTLAEIARRAGVSTATVSYVLNDKPGGRIPEATARAVRKIADEVGYTPNVAAQALRTGKSRVVLFIIPHLPINFTIGEMMTEIGSQLDEHGYVAAMITGERKLDLPATVHATAPAAAISLVDLTEAEKQLLATRGITLMQTAFASFEVQGGWHRDVQRELVYRQVDHLVDQGHTRLGWAQPKDPRLIGLANQRMAWAKERTKHHRLPVPAVQSFQLRGAQADKALAAWRAKGVTAVACYNDLWGMATIEAARRAHLRIPEELAVIGIDNIPLTEIVEPTLTSVSVHMKRNVQALIRELMADMAGEPLPVPDIGPMIKFVQRGST